MKLRVKLNQINQILCIAIFFLLFEELLLMRFLLKIEAQEVKESVETLFFHFWIFLFKLKSMLISQDNIIINYSFFFVNLIKFEALKVINFIFFELYSLVTPNNLTPQQIIFYRFHMTLQISLQNFKKFIIHAVRIFGLANFEINFLLQKLQIFPLRNLNDIFLLFFSFQHQIMMKEQIGQKIF